MLRVMALFLLSGPGEEEEDEEETAEEKSSVSIEEWVEVNTLGKGSKPPVTDNVR